MTATLIAVLALLLFLMILAIGVPIGIAMGMVGFLGILALRGDAAFATLFTIPYSSMASWSLSVIPMFLLMGYVGFHAGFTKDAYETAYKWLGRLPGGLAIATLFGGAAFGACSGSSIAATAALGKIAIPEMERMHYDLKLACGTAALAGTLDALIPPSILLVLYGIAAEQSVGKLLIAGIVPGILCMLTFSALIFVRATINPALAPRGAKTSFGEKIASLTYTAPLVIIFIVVVAGLYTGVFTPTEAGATGALAILVIAVAMGRIGLGKLRESVMETVRVTCSIFVIVLGAYIFVQFLAMSRLPISFAEWVVGLPVHRMWILIGVLGVYLVLGCFLDALGLILLTVPFIFPAIKAMGFDPIWFGVIVTLMAEISLVTPPVGMNIFVISGVAKDVPMYSTFRAMGPYLIPMLILVVLLTAFPQIALFLPTSMK